MHVSALFLVLTVLFSEGCGKLYHWREAYLTKRVSIRLVKKNWRPIGPSSETDDFLDEYKWDVDSAYQALSRSKYEYVVAPLAESDKLFELEGEYDKSKDSIIIIHPISANADVFFVSTTINALAMRNVHRQYNVFAVHMPALNANMVFTVFKNMLFSRTKYEDLAEVVSKFIIKAVNKKYLRPSQIHLIGWSYSAHLVGYIARYIYLLYDRKVNSIIALDPYTNSFNQDLFHVSQADAEVVHLYHTSSGLAGTRERVGTADFVFNDGHTMPECTGWKLLKSPVPLPMACSHLKVVQRWWYVILYPSRFLARKCDSWNRLESCYCDQNQSTQMTYPIQNRGDTGIYFLRTVGGKPYGVGQWGSECSSLRRTELANRRNAERARYGITDLQLFDEPATPPESPPASRR